MTKVLRRLSACACLAGGMLATVPDASGQQVEVGVQTTYIDLAAADASAWGVGGRFGWEVLPYLTLEADVTAFPQDVGRVGSFVQVLGGAKVGGRTRGYGIFAKLRPGFVRFDRDFIQPGTACIAVVPTPRACLATRTNGALDFGTVLEIYPTSSLTLRADIGTTYIWYGSRGEGRRRRDGNFQLGFGAGLRF